VNKRDCEKREIILVDAYPKDNTSTQKCQFVATAREGNWLSRLRMANEI